MMTDSQVIDALRRQAVPIENYSDHLLQAFCQEMRCRTFGDSQTANAFDFFKEGYKQGIIRCGLLRG